MPDTMLSHDALQTAERVMRGSDQRMAHIARQWRGVMDQADRLDCCSDLPAMKAAVEEANRLEKIIRETPAEGYLGIAIKLALLERVVVQSLEATEPAELCYVALLEDAERLAGQRAPNREQGTPTKAPSRPPSPDARLLKLWADYEQAVAAAQAADAAAQKAEEELEEEMGQPFPFVLVARCYDEVGDSPAVPVFLHSEKEIQEAEYLGPVGDPAADARRARAIERLEISREDFRRERERLNLPALDAASDQAWKAVAALDHQIFRTPPATLQGLVLRFRHALMFFARENVEGPLEKLDFEYEALMRAVRELERLAGSGA